MENKPAALLIPEWPAPANVKAWVTSRYSISNNNSKPANSLGAFNLATHVEDSIDTVTQNREALKAKLEESLDKEQKLSRIQWLEQVHGTQIITATDMAVKPVPQADAIYCQLKGVACAVLTADCLPVIFCSDDGKEIAVAHAGWRGLADGILQLTLEKFKASPDHILAWLGPAIGPCHFQVGDEIKQIFVQNNSGLASCFTPSNREGFETLPHWNADLFQIAKKILLASGLQSITGGGLCTYCENQRFYSFRYCNEQNQQSGRFATLICLA